MKRIGYMSNIDPLGRESRGGFSLDARRRGMRQVRIRQPSITLPHATVLTSAEISGQAGGRAT